MLEDRFARPDTGNGFILDGYPRNLAQAAALDQLLARIGQPMDFAVQLDVPTDLLVERIAGRAKAEGRADDSPESVRNRLDVYDEPDRAGDRFLPPARPADRGRRRRLARRGVQPDRREAGSVPTSDGRRVSVRDRLPRRSPSTRSPPRSPEP